MADTNISANMNLPIPSVGIDPGPDWAQNINSCLTLIDGHDHTSGNGVQITPAGINISADLLFNSQNATLLRSVRFAPQLSVLSGATDLGCLSVVGVDLYFNDVSGNKIRITESGNVAGTPGSISNLVSPASASYVSANQAFVWQSDTNTPANLDAGSVIIRNVSANAHGVTVSAPAALATDYSLTLPQLPGSTLLMTLTSSGLMGTVANATIADTLGAAMTSAGANAIAATMTSTGTNSIISTMGATGANAIATNVTATGANHLTGVRTRTLSSNPGANGIGIASITPLYTNSTTSPTSTGAVVTYTSSAGNRPLVISLSGGGFSGTCYVTTTNPVVTSAYADLMIAVNGGPPSTVVTVGAENASPSSSANLKFYFPPSSFYQVGVTPSAGAVRTFELFAKCNGANMMIAMDAVQLVVYEL